MKTLIHSTSLAALALVASGCQEDPPVPCDTDVVGNICTIAGRGENGYDRDAEERDLPALEAKFSLPQDTLTGSDGTVFILDWNNHRLRALADGEVRWIAGRGELGGSLDDPENGDFNHPTNMIWDQSGENIVLAAWHNSKIRTVNPTTGDVTDTCGDGKRAYFGNDGPAAMSSLDLPASIAYDPAGNLVIMDQANQVLRHIDTEGMIHLRAGQCVIDAPMPNGPGLCAEGVAPTPCPADMAGRASGKSTCGDPMTTCSKPCTPGYTGDEIPATELRMAQPFGQSASPAGRIAFGPDGNLYFADTGNHIIRMIDADGIVHRVAGQPPADGVAQSGYEGDGGPALAARLDYPVDLAFGDDGTLYFSDVRNHCVRAIDASGTISTVVGVCGEQGYEGDGGPADEALINLAFGIEYVDGRLQVADTGNHVIRTVLLR
jgi:outer membrane protein assembly factor BamB